MALHVSVCCQKCHVSKHRRSQNTHCFPAPNSRQIVVPHRALDFMSRLTRRTVAFPPPRCKSKALWGIRKEPLPALSDCDLLFLMAHNRAQDAYTMAAFYYTTRHVSNHMRAVFLKESAVPWSHARGAAVGLRLDGKSHFLMACERPF